MQLLSFDSPGGQPTVVYQDASKSSSQKKARKVPETDPEKMTLQGLNASIRSKMNKYHDALNTANNSLDDYKSSIETIESYCQAYPSYAEKPKFYITYLNYIKERIDGEFVLFYQPFYQAYIFFYDTADLQKCMYKKPDADGNPVDAHLLSDFADALQSLAELIDPDREDADMLKAQVINMKEVYGRRLVDEKLNAFDVDAMEYNAV